MYCRPAVRDQRLCGHVKLSVNVGQCKYHTYVHATLLTHECSRVIDEDKMSFKIEKKRKLRRAMLQSTDNERHQAEEGKAQTFIR